MIRLGVNVPNFGPEADVGAILAWGFAPWTGGPITFIDQTGL